jgi:WhiB family redox-sensing transcriptional regulator
MVTDRSKVVCSCCPVQGECLDYALTNRITHFVYGGMSGRERQKLLRKKASILVDSPDDAMIG